MSNRTTTRLAIAAAAAKLSASDVFSPLEFQARALLHAAREVDWTPTRAAVLNVFVAQWSSSLPLSRVVQCAAGINQGITEDSARAALTALVRDGVLRSYVARGTRHWEVRLV